MFEKMNKLASLKQDIEAQVKDALKEASVDFFNKHPDTEAIRWVQYIPGFNDGEPCLFSLGDIEVKFNDNADTSDEESDYGDDFYSRWSLRNDATRSELKNDLSEFEGLLNDLECVLQGAFGENCKVTVTRNEIKLDEYDCGY